METQNNKNDEFSDDDDGNMVDRNIGVYKGEKYFPVPYPFEDADYTKDPNFFSCTMV